MQKIKRISALFLSLVIVAGLLGTAAFAAPSTDPWKSPQQVVAAMTENPQNEMVVTWTTIDLTLTDAKVEVTPSGGGETVTFTAVKTNRSVSSSSMRLENGGNVTQKAFYVASLTGLSPDTAYEFICSAVDSEGLTHESVGNAFITAPGAKDAFSFIYLSDTQTSGTNGKAMTVNSGFWAKHDPRFVYIAGDLTDTAANEGQWEIFFNQKTPGMANANQFSDNYSSAMSGYALAAVQGNHDNNTFSNHINYAASGGTNITYAYTYGSARFIMLNFENTASRPAQQAFLREQVADAKENGLWTVVGFHKSIYSGASHMTDSDATDARRYWAPVFAELDVDVVLQGHDHVLSRGFVDAEGNNARSAQDINYQKVGDRTYTAEKPSNAPLYYVGNCASTLKFYNATAGNAAHAAPDYGFLDINSARDAGHAQNPDGPRSLDSSDAKLTYPTYTSVTVEAGSITFETYFFQYDSVTDLIVTQPFLFDRFTVTRTLPDYSTAEASISAAEDVVVVNKPVDVFVALNNMNDVNLVELEYTFDADYLGFNGVHALTALNGFSIVEASVSNYYGSSLYKGKVTLMHPGGFVTCREATDILQISGVAKGNIGDTAVTLDSIGVFGKDAEGNAGEQDARIVAGAAEIAIVDWTPVFSVYDLNKGPVNGKTSIVDALDLSIAVSFYQMRDTDADWEVPGYNNCTAKAADVNGSGVVNLADLIEIMANYGPYSIFPG